MFPDGMHYLRGLFHPGPSANDSKHRLLFQGMASSIEEIIFWTGWIFTPSNSYPVPPRPLAIYFLALPVRALPAPPHPAPPRPFSPFPIPPPSPGLPEGLSMASVASPQVAFADAGAAHGKGHGKGQHMVICLLPCSPFCPVPPVFHPLPRAVPPRRLTP
jgi:hypothetical protein